MNITDKRVIGAIVVLAVVLGSGAYLYYSDVQRIWDTCKTENPDLLYCVYSVQRDSGAITQVELLTANITTEDSTDFVRWKLDKDALTFYNGRLIGAKAQWYVDYYQTYGEDKWINLKKKSTKIDLSIEEFDTYVILRKKTEYYATASLSGTGGWLVEEFKVGQDWHKYTVAWQPSDGRLSALHKVRWNLSGFGLGQETPRVLKNEYVLNFDKLVHVNWLDAQQDFNFATLTSTNLEVNFNEQSGIIFLDPGIGTGWAKNDFFSLTSNTAQCLAECQATFKLCNPTNDFIETSDKADFDMAFIKKEESVDLVDYYFEEEVFIDINKAIYKSVKHSDDLNKINDYYTNEIDNWKIVKERNWKKVSFNDILIPAKNCKTIRLTGIKKAKLGENGIDWIPTVGGFEINEFAWWDSDWGYKQEITLDTTTYLSGDITNDHVIPVWIDKDNTTFWAAVQADGDDVRFVNSDDVTELDFYLERFSAVDDNMVAWVEISDSFDANADMTFDIYYGNAAATTGQDYQNAFPAIYTAVWDFNETAGTVGVDKSSEAGYDLVHANTPSLGINGIVNGGIDYDNAASESSSNGTLLDGAIDELSFSFWLLFDGGWSSAQTADDQIQNKINNATNAVNWYALEGDGSIQWRGVDGAAHALTSSQTSWVADTWYHIVGTYSNTDNKMVLYVNDSPTNGGILNTALGQIAAGTQTDFFVAQNSGGSEYFDGSYDQFEVFGSTVLTEADAQLLYHSQHFDMQTFGTAETNVAPVVTIFSPGLDSWKEGKINLKVNVVHPGLVGGWLDTNLSGSCWADINISSGDNNKVWDSNQTGCAAKFDVNLTAYADGGGLLGFASKSVTFHVDTNAINTYTADTNSAWKNADVNVRFDCQTMFASSTTLCKNMFWGVVDRNYQQAWATAAQGDHNKNVVFTENGRHNIYFWSNTQEDDNELTQMVTLSIDTNNPVVVIYYPNDGNMNYSSDLVSFDLNDVGSGINSSTIRVDINGVQSSAFNFATDCTIKGDVNYSCYYYETAFDTNSRDYNVTIRVDDNVSRRGSDTAILKFVAFPAVRFGNVNDGYIDDDSGIDLYPSDLVDYNVTPYGQIDANGIFNLYNVSAGTSSIDVKVDLNMALPNDSLFALCKQNRRVAVDGEYCWDINASSKALIVDDLAVDANKMFWGFFDLNIIGYMGYELVVDYRYSVAFGS